MLHKYLPDNRFDKLKIPLTVAATEIRMGKVTYFDSGELIPAVIASSSIPALFSPSQFNGNLYVDGGLMDNLPVRPLIGKCDIIIGSQCNPVQQRFDVKSVKEITERSLLLAISVNSTQSKSHCNVVIEPPELAKFGTFDLARGKEIFAIGYNYTRESFKVEDFQLKKDDSLYED